MKKLIFTIILVATTFLLSATTYYVSNAGNDSNNGTSQSTAWKTISKINGRTFAAGDNILFKKGDTWRETLTIPSSGTSTSYITFGSYGSGNRPKIYGSTKLITWTVYSGNIWTSSTTVKDPYSVDGYKAEIFFEEGTNLIWGHVKKSSISACTKEYDWTWSSSHIYIYSTDDPNESYTSIEAPQRGIVINLNNKQYITIDGLDVRYSSLALIKEVYPASNLTGLTIKNCHVAGVGTKGSTVGYGLSLWHSKALIQNNIIHDCGRRACSYNIDNSVAVSLSNVTIEFNEFYHGFHTTGPDIGHTGSSTFDNFIIRNNYIWDDPTWVMDGVEYIEDAVGIFVGNNSPTTGKFQNFYIYDNIIKNNPFKGMEFSGTTSNVNIYNNTFYGYNPTSTQFGAQIYINANTKTLNIKNNIFYDNCSNAKNKYHPCIYRQDGATNITVDYNLYWRTDASSPAWNFGGTMTMANWSTYKSKTGNDSHSPTPADPKFTSDYHLQSNSPAINKGVYIAEVLTDYEGNNFGNPRNIGAYSSLVTRIGDVFQNKILVYPNPAVDHITITGYKMKRIQIVNYLGIIVVDENIENNILYFNLKSGIYFVILDGKSNKMIVY
jgi:hypothetical protein